MIFNRPELTRQVFESIRESKPKKLYISSDGPRLWKEGELRLVEDARSIINNIDWNCEIHTLFREENLGCKRAVSEAITWFFQNEEEGIILEDDCLPNKDFFIFCETLLNKYRTDESVWVISGTNFLSGKYSNHSYYYSRINHVWGWASWRRSWKYYDVNLEFWSDYQKSDNWNNYWKNNEIKKYWETVFSLVYENKIDTWDYQWTAAMWYNNGLAVLPSVNLVKNIGFGVDATHTHNIESALSNLKYNDLKIDNFPPEIVNNLNSDYLVHKKFILPPKTFKFRILELFKYFFK